MRIPMDFVCCCPEDYTPDNGTVQKAINAKIAIPHHFDMFEFNTASPDEFTKACESLKQPFCVLQNGQGWSSATLK